MPIRRDDERQHVGSMGQYRDSCFTAMSRQSRVTRSLDSVEACES